MVIWDAYSTQLGAVTPKLLWDTHYFQYPTMYIYIYVYSIYIYVASSQCSCGGFVYFPFLLDPFSRLERRWKRSSQKMAIGTLGMLGESTTAIQVYILVNILRKKQDDCRHCRFVFSRVPMTRRYWMSRKRNPKKNNIEETNGLVFVQGFVKLACFLFDMLNFVSGKVLSMRYVLPRLG